MGISDWFKRFRSGEHDLDVERAEEKAREEGTRRTICPARKGASTTIWTTRSKTSPAGARRPRTLLQR